MRFKLLSIALPLVLSLAFVALFVLPFKAFATDPSSINVDIAPENPTPNENTTITLSSYAANLDSIKISWSVNGIASAAGIGLKSCAVNAPAAGVQTTVTAILSFPDGDVEKDMVIKPSVMILLWQAEDSYVPPFYEGKAMPTSDSEVKVVAMPEIKTSSGMADPNNMTYTWQQDYNNEQGASGYSNNSYTYTNDYLENSNNIDVTATTIDGNYSAEGNINIDTYNPKIDFYKKDAALGTLWEQALSDGHQVQGSEIIQAAPYFISPGDIRIPTLTWTWSINGQTVTAPNSINNLFPIQAPAGVSGISQLSLTIDSTDKVFETATKTINIQY